jgi:hypothetical protein
MLNLIDLPKPIVSICLVKAEINYVNLVIHAVCVVARDCHYKFIIFSSPEGHSVVLEVTLICIDLLCHSTLDKDVDVVFECLCVRLAILQLLY